MKLFWIVLIVVCSCVQPIPVFGQSDTTDQADEDQSVIPRKWNAEVALGPQWGVHVLDRPVKNEHGTELTELLRVSLNITGGVHIPLYNLGKTSTLWLVANPGVGVVLGNVINDAGELEDRVSALYQVPVHVTAAIGGLRRRAHAWGIEGGLGLNFAHELGQFVIAPSLLVDVTYAPKGINRVRFMMDVIPVAPTGGGSYRRFSIAYVWGFMY